MKSIIYLILLFVIVKPCFSQKPNYDSLTLVKQQVVLDFLNLSSNDKIADIGTGAGYSLVPIAGSFPHITFTVEDIDSSTLNRKKLIAQIKRFGNKANIHQFNIVYGTTTSTNLPASSFNKVLMFDVVHEMSDRQTMLNDVKRILQKGGSLFIEEILVYKPQKKERHCNYPFFTEIAFKQLMTDNNFILKKEKISFETGHKKYIKMFEYQTAN